MVFRQIILLSLTAMASTAELLSAEPLQSQVVRNNQGPSRLLRSSFSPNIPNGLKTALSSAGTTLKNIGTKLKGGAAKGLTKLKAQPKIIKYGVPVALIAAMAGFHHHNNKQMNEVRAKVADAHVREIFEGEKDI